MLRSLSPKSRECSRRWSPSFQSLASLRAPGKECRSACFFFLFLLAFSRGGGWLPRIGMMWSVGLCAPRRSLGFARFSRGFRLWGVTGFWCCLWGDFGLVVRSTLLLRALPLASYAGRDLRCDKGAAFVLASNQVQLDTWDTPGILLFQLLMALSTGMWLGAEACSPRELFFNTMCGYYLILLSVQEAWQKRGVGWQSQFLHVFTTRNLLYTTIHMTESLRHWPSASL